MVVSLESQNVAIRKNYNIPKISFPRVAVSFDLYNSDLLPYIIAIFIVSLIFSTTPSVFKPSILNKKIKHIDVNAITLPVHYPNIINQKKLDTFEKQKINRYYTVEKFYSADNISSISIKKRISIYSILSVNKIWDIKKIKSIKNIKIPVMDGILYKVLSRDTLGKISKKYGVLIKDIFRANDLKSDSLLGVNELFIPVDSPQKYMNKSNIDKFFIYPVKGFISKRYGYNTNNITEITTKSEGVYFSPIDKGNVVASRGGYVSFVGYNANYGKYLYIDHPGEKRSLYANLDSISVKRGDVVKQNQMLGALSQKKYGFNQLFFSIFYREETVNPENYLL